MIDPKTILSCFSSKKTLLETLNEIKEYLTELDKKVARRTTYHHFGNEVKIAINHETKDIKITAIGGSTRVKLLNDNLELLTLTLSSNDILFFAASEGKYSVMKFHSGSTPSTYDAEGYEQLKISITGEALVTEY